MARGKWSLAKKTVHICLLTFAFCHLPCRSAHALNVTNVTFSGDPITFETASFPNGTTINFTIDQPGEVQVLISKVANFSDTLSTNTIVGNLIQSYSTSGAQQLFWNALWLINGDFGRMDGNYSFSLALSTGPTTGPTTTPSTLVQINSIDIHNVSVAPSFDSNHAATFPYVISYALAKQGQVTVTIANSSGTIVRTLLPNKVQSGENTGPVTLIWDGLGDDLRPVSIGLYNVTINATDPSTSPVDHAILRNRAFAVESLAGVAQDPQKLFESNAFVFPNPVRNGLGTFQFQAIRDGATIFLKIYTLTGTLVLDKEFDGITAGSAFLFPWDVTNAAGNKVGRGLYYYVLKEQDSQGTLQTVKKMAVLP